MDALVNDAPLLKEFDVVSNVQDTKVMIYYTGQSERATIYISFTNAIQRTVALGVLTALTLSSLL